MFTGYRKSVVFLFDNIHQDDVWMLARIMRYSLRYELSLLDSLEKIPHYDHERLKPILQQHDFIAEIKSLIVGVPNTAKFAVSPRNETEKTFSITVSY